MKCGIGDYTYCLAEALSQSSSNQIAVLTSVFDSGNSLPYNHVVFPKIRKWSLTELFTVIKTIWSWSPNIVHIQYPTQGYGRGLLPWVLPVVSFLMGKKVVQTWHEHYSRREVIKFLFKALTPSALIFVRSQYVTNMHSQLRYFLCRKKLVYIPNASAILKAVLDQQTKSTLKKQYLKKQKRLIVFFGFIYPHKGVDLLFDIADPVSDYIFIAGEFDENSDCFNEIMERASSEQWLGKVSISGFLSRDNISMLLAVADAVVLPFRLGGGEWNTSIHGAVLNGAFVLTTSLNEHGYDKKRNIYFAEVDNIQEMKKALVEYAGVRREFSSDVDKDEWQEIANKHTSLYNSL
jgi:glycosyltransferase involved in cell wall biosynthesis